MAGWTFSAAWQSSDQVRQHLIQPYAGGDGTVRTIAHTVVREGGCLVLWVVLESASGSRWVECNLMCRGESGWGYRDIQEHLGPTYFSCPTEFLDMASDPPNLLAEKWRCQVRERHTMARAA